MNNSILGAFTEIIDEAYMLLALKILVLIGIAVYCIFALTVYRQTGLMDNVLKIPIRPSFKSIARVYFFVAIAYFCLALLFL